MSYIIEKNIPIPTATRKGAGRPCKYPWNDMNPGDSFLVPGVESAKLGSLASKRGKTHGGKFVVRGVKGGTRIWRSPTARARRSSSPTSR